LKYGVSSKFDQLGRVASRSCSKRDFAGPANELAETRLPSVRLVHHRTKIGLYDHRQRTCKEAGCCSSRDHAGAGSIGCLGPKGITIGGCRLCHRSCSSVHVRLLGTPRPYLFRSPGHSATVMDFETRAWWRLALGSELPANRGVFGNYVELQPIWAMSIGDIRPKHSSTSVG